MPGFSYIRLFSGRRARRLALVALLAASGLLAWSLFVEPRRLVLHEATLTLPHWHPAHAGLRVALLSDLHVGAPFWGVERTRRLVEEVNALGPDLVLLGGDYVIDHLPFGTKTAPETIAEILSQLHAPFGVYAVLGNHDAGNHPRRIAAAFRARGITVLEDELVTREVRGQPLTLVGLADQLTHAGRARATLDRAPTDSSVLLLVHEPDVFPELDERASLVLAGHTHGGQVRLPLLGRPRIGWATRYGERFAAGEIVEEGRHLFVTTGIGTSVFPVRFGVPPEIALLTLR